MPAYYTSLIRFPCPICTAQVQEVVPVPGTNWSGDTADERYVYDHETVDCPVCGAGHEVELGNQDGSIFARLSEYSQVSVEASPALLNAEEAEVDWDLPSNPAFILEKTLTEIRALLDVHGDEQAPTVFNRMAFSQQVAAFEAYLGDFLLNQVKFKPRALANIVAGDKELKSTSLTLAQVLADPQAVKKAVAQHLQAQLYHNLPKVELLYQMTLSISPFPNRELRERLLKAMPIRHDCVHRNGTTKDGERRVEVTASFVRQTEADVRAVMNHIEAMVD